MSSSRAIAAARNKRAGETRPNTSIGSSTIFSQQSRGQPQVQRQTQPQPQNQKQKISVGDAIGLTTIRLCKVENFIKELKETGMPEMPANAQLVDNSILTSMINRLDALEKKEIANNEKIKQLEKELSDLTRETGEKFADFDTALIEIEKQLPEVQDFEVTEDTMTLSADIITADLKTLVDEVLTVEDVST
jgi:hypothetical protein